MLRCSGTASRSVAERVSGRSKQASCGRNQIDRRHGARANGDERHRAEAGPLLPNRTTKSDFLDTLWESIVPLRLAPMGVYQRFLLNGPGLELPLHAQRDRRVLPPIVSCIRAVGITHHLHPLQHHRRNGADREQPAAIGLSKAIILAAAGARRCCLVQAPIPIRSCRSCARPPCARWRGRSPCLHSLLPARCA